MRARSVLVLVLVAMAGCDDSTAAPVHASACPAGVVFGSCDEGDACFEWGYPPDRFSELSVPGAASCPTSGGSWSDGPCKRSKWVGGCLTVGSDTCSVVWLGASDSLNAEMQLCENILAGSWVTP
jgi:hypothetical protein